MNNDTTFAFVTIGSGSYLGSTVRDLTLANHLHRRGYKVVLYWMMECNPELVDSGIRQRMLCYGTRYQFRRPSEFLDRIIGRLLFLLPLKVRIKVTQDLLPGFVDLLLKNLICSLNDRPDGDRRLTQRLLHFMQDDKVDCLMMSFASISPLALDAKKTGKHDFDYLVTFQGDEQFANYARRAGISEQYRCRLEEVIQHSRWPAITVSQDYLERIADEMGLDAARLTVLYNGVEMPERAENPPFSILKADFPDLDESVPLVSYVGRQDTEKGVDLLLYAARLLHNSGIRLQLVICGSTAKGKTYQTLITDLADHLGLSIHHAGPVAIAVRDALYAHSHCMVYPSVNREAFGLVAAEGMSHGTPVIVPDFGGITEVVQDGEKAGGLTFKTWDSGDLAGQIERLLSDRTLYDTLAASTRSIASRFSAERMTDNVLALMGTGDPAR